MHAFHREKTTETHPCSPLIQDWVGSGLQGTWRRIYRGGDLWSSTPLSDRRRVRKRNRIRWIWLQIAKSHAAHCSDGTHGWVCIYILICADAECTQTFSVHALISAQVYMYRYTSGHSLICSQLGKPVTCTYRHTSSWKWPPFNIRTRSIRSRGWRTPLKTMQ